MKGPTRRTALRSTGSAEGASDAMESRKAPNDALSVAQAAAMTPSRLRENG